MFIVIRRRIMIPFNAQIIKKNGKKEYAVIPYEEYLQVRAALQDYEDLRALREAKETEKDAGTISLEELKTKLSAKQAFQEKTKPTQTRRRA